MTQIFLIEDSLPDVAIIRLALQSIIPKFKFIPIRNLREVKSKLNEHLDPNPGPKLILSDYFVHAHTAFDMLKVIRHHPIGKHIPVCVLSAYDKQEIVQELYKAGANAFIHKPSDYDELVFALKQVIEGLLKPIY